MRTNFKLIVSLPAAAAMAVQKPRLLHATYPRMAPSHSQSQSQSQSQPQRRPQEPGIGFADRHWPGLDGTLRNRPFAAVKENDCNYASLFLNFHAVHLPRLWLLLRQLPVAAAAEAAAAAHHFGLGSCGGFGH